MSEHGTLVERLARHVRDLDYDRIPAEPMRLAKLLVYDTLGTGLGGYQELLGRKAVDFVLAAMPGDGAAILGDGGRSTSEGAAFANATMVKILGMDDSHRSASHIAAQVIPAALAAGEARRTDGRTLLAAIVGAYDVAVRVGRAVHAEQRRRGLDVKGTVGAIAAAAAAGRCAGLDAEGLSDAMALAADMASGTEQYVYEPGQCETKDLIAGFAARNGVFATQLAAHGFRGPRGALDGEYGFFRAFGPGRDVDPGPFADLGEHYAIETTAFKPHGGCRHTHQAVDAVQRILGEVDLRPADVSRVVVKTYRYATEPFFRVDPDPPARGVAGLSIRVATALALVRGRAWPEDFAHWDDPEVRRLRRLTEVEVDPEIEAAHPERNGARVVVELADGRSFAGFTPYAKGEPELRLTEAELTAKFDALTRAVLPPGRAEAIYDLCLHLERAEEVGELVGLTSSRAVAGRRLAVAGV